MQVQQNYSLKKYNTFAIDAKARYFAAFKSIEELEILLKEYQSEKKLLLGGGSNVLFTKDFDGLVIKNDLKGIHTVHEDVEHVYVTSAAGENWHQFVMHAVKHDLAGVENLSLIPGCVGASPMQNIGAYGVELKDVFHSLEAFHIDDHKKVTFSLNDCEFGYRESVFKKICKDQYVILNVTFRLNKKHHINISYGEIKQELEKMGIVNVDIAAVSQAVINIRSSKLPDPNVIGNAGSFFKNPEISLQQFQSLKNNFPGIVGFILKNGNLKLSAGGLIEQCGWKGFRRGDAGCYEKQALVLVNYNAATGEEIYDLSREIQESVREKFNVDLKREVNII